MANNEGGVNGRMLRLIVADDGYEPTRTTETMKQLYDKEQVFGFVRKLGTATSMVAAPFALERQSLLYAAYTGANALRRDPPDRYVFNYRASYAEETEAAVRYLVKVRRGIRARAGSAQCCRSAGCFWRAPVLRAWRKRCARCAAAMAVSSCERLTLEIHSRMNPAIAQLKASKTPIKAVVMVATYTHCFAKILSKNHAK